MIDVAIMGHGVVGSGVVEVIDQHKLSISKKAKEEIRYIYFLDGDDCCFCSCFYLGIYFGRE